MDSQSKLADAGEKRSFRTRRLETRESCDSWTRTREIKATAPHIAFVSHQWTGFGKPDHTGTQYKCMVQACKALLFQGVRRSLRMGGHLLHPAGQFGPTAWFNRLSCRPRFPLSMDCFCSACVSARRNQHQAVHTANTLLRA